MQDIKERVSGMIDWFDSVPLEDIDKYNAIESERMQQIRRLLIDVEATLQSLRIQE